MMNITEERFLPESGIIVYTDEFDVEDLTAEEIVVYYMLANHKLQQLDPDWREWDVEDPEEWTGYRLDAFDLLPSLLANLQQEYFPGKTEHEILAMLDGRLNLNS